MESWRQVAENIYQINAIDTWHPIVDIYLIKDKYPALIDTGPSVAIPRVLEILHHLGQESLSYIFLTHIHMDHGGGAGFLSQRLPQAKVIVHPQGARHLIDPAKLIAGTQELFGESFQKEFGSILPVAEYQVQPVQDGEVVSLGDRELNIVYSPGHSLHHISFYEKRRRELFCGEALGGLLPGINFTLPLISPPRFDLKVYLNTLRHLRSLSPSILFYGHGGAKQDIKRQFNLIYESIILSLRILQEGLSAGETPEQMINRVYSRVSKEAVGGFELTFITLFKEGVSYLKENGISLDSLLQEIEEDKGI